MRIVFLTIFMLFSSNIYSQSINKLFKSIQKDLNSENYRGALESALIADSIYAEDYGTENSGYSELLSRIGSLYYALQEYPEAEEYFKKSLENFKEYTNIEDEKEYVFTLNEYSGMLVAIERFADAESLINETLELQNSAKGEHSSEYAYSLYTLGYLQLNTGNYKDAESNLKKSINIWKNNGGEDDEDVNNYTHALYSLADLYYAKEEYKNSLPLYIDVSRRYKKEYGEKDSSYAISLADLGDVYTELSDFNAAYSSYQKAIEIIGEVNGLKSEDYADCSFRIASMYREIGDFDKSETYYRQALSIQDENGYNNENTLFGLSALYQIMGNFPASEKLCLEVLRRDEKKGKNSLDYIAAQNLLANHYTLTGSYEKALALYKDIGEKSKIAQGENSSSYAVNRDNLANLYVNMGEYLLAAPEAHKAMEIKIATYGEFSPAVAYSLHNLVDVYKYLGDTVNAENSLRKMSEIYLKSYGENNYEYAGSLSSLALFYLEGNRLNEAEQLYNKAVDIIKKQLGEKHPMYTNIIMDLCEIYEITGRPDEAEILWMKANSNLNNEIVQNFSFMAEKEKEEFIAGIRSGFERMTSFVFRRKEIRPSITTVSYNNELALKGIVLQSSKAMRQIALNSKDEKLINLYDTYFRNKQLLSKLNQIASSQRLMNVDSLESVCTEEEKDLSMRIKLLNGSADLSGIGNQVTWLDVRKALGPKDAAVEFISFSYNNINKLDDSSTYYCALVLRPEMIQPEMVFLFNEIELKELLEKTKSPNDATTALRLYKMPSLKSEEENALYKLIWKPIAKLFSGVEKIYYSPAGLLNRISFDAIPADDHSYLSDKYMMIAVTSTKSILNNAKDSYVNKNVNEPVVYGGINYDSDTITMKSAASRYMTDNRSSNIQYLPGDQIRGGSFGFLEGTLQEATKINSILGRLKVNSVEITGSDATEESFKALNNLKSPPFIHIATHGFFFPEPARAVTSLANPGSSSLNQFKGLKNPLARSGLIFAGANHSWNNRPLPAGVEDGILLASEVSEMYLPNTMLVVLSACETALGDIKGAEGVFGLQRAFKMAGVKYLLMSLWQVPDYQTSELMSKFYENWLTGLPIHDSFRNAQSFMKHKYPGDPYNWAAFVLVD